MQKKSKNDKPSSSSDDDDDDMGSFSAENTYANYSFFYNEKNHSKARTLRNIIQARILDKKYFTFPELK